MKPHPDSLQRFLFEQSHVRGELVHLDDAWRAVLERRGEGDLLFSQRIDAALFDNAVRQERAGQFEQVRA